MKLGILLNKDSHLRQIVGLASAAIDKNHTVIIFAMDKGTRLLQEKKFLDLAKHVGISVSFCSHSAKEIGVITETLPDHVSTGSQLNNAMMIHDADKVIVL